MAQVMMGIQEMGVLAEAEAEAHGIQSFQLVD